MQVDLSEHGAPIAATIADVAMFKEPVTRSRVVAESQQFVVYSLKNPATLRVLSRVTGNQGTCKLHKNEVELAKFVNFKSSVIATAAKDEFFVWYLTATKDAVETHTYFSIVNQATTIRSVSWFIDSKSRTPDMLVMYGTTAAQLSSSRIILDYKGPGSEAAQPSLKDITIPFDHAVSQDASLTTVGADGLFAFAIDSVSVAACWARRGSSTLRPCDGETVIGLELLNDKPATLAAACDKFVAVWSLDGEPSRLFKLTVGSPIVLLSSVLNTFAIFSSNKELFLVDMAPQSVGKSRISQTTRHGLKFQVTGGSRSNVVNATDGGVSVISDFGNRLSLHFVKHAFSSASPQVAPRPQVAPATSQPAPATTKFVDPAIVSAAPIASVVQQPPAYNTPLAVLPTPLASATPVIATPSRLVSNPTLPQVSQDGLIARALQDSLSAHNQTKQQLSSVIENTSSVLQVGPQMLKRDHANLVTLSLEAQMTELQNSIKNGEISIGGASPPQAAASNGFESQLLATLTDDIAKRLAEGLVPGLRDALLGDLEPQMRTAVVNQLKKSQKDTFKSRVDALLKNVAAEFAGELERKQKIYEKQFLDYGKEVRRISEASIQKILQYLDATENQLAAIQTAGILEELSSLRKEVNDLREAAALSGQPTIAAAVLSPATAIDTAKKLILSNQTAQGLSYVVRMNRPETTVALFEDLKTMDEEIHDSLLEVKDDALWSTVLVHFTSVRSSENLLTVLFWMKSIVAEHPGTAQVPAAKLALNAFVANWKKEAPAGVVGELNSIQKLIK